MKTNSEGFTLIEIIVILVLLAILVAVAIPKYVDLTTTAKKTADDAYVDGLRAETILLYASNLLQNSNVDHSGAGPVGDTVPITNFWPLKSQITNGMMQTYSNKYYTNFYYNATNGTWTPLL